MKALELFEKYPEAGEVIIQYYADQFLRSVESTDAPEEFKEFAKQQRIDDQYVADFIDNNPRGTFDVFDANEVYIQINVPKFSYSINEGDVIAGSWETRKEAEVAAVEQAFETLNKKLCQTK